MSLLKMEIENLAFLVDRLGEDCTPLQFLRELTHNSIQAIQRTPEGAGTILWHVEEVEGVPKLAITDTGDGMTEAELRGLINRLAASCYDQSRHGNFGIGAKIAAATKNPHGLVYRSWKDGDGTLVWLYRDEKENEYGLKDFEVGDGRYDHCLKLDPEQPDSKHELIGDHGTTVILMGKAADDDTTEPPDCPEAKNPSRWVPYYLNRRYFELPEGVTLRALTKNGYLQVRGQRYFLDNHCREGSGTVQIKGARVHWWIVDKEGATAGEYYFRHHVAALYQGELYGMALGRRAATILQQFGIVVGYQHVVLYVEPTLDSISPNTQRTELRCEGEVLPWEDWASEFREKLPRPIKRLMERINAQTPSKDHTKTIRNRLKEVHDFRLPRYRPDSSGEEHVAEETEVGNPASPGGGSSSGGCGGSSSRNPFDHLRKKGDDDGKGTKQKTDIYPECKWVSAADGSRAPGMIEDRAARYLPEQNLIQINADFRGYQDLVTHWQKEFAYAQAGEETIIDTVRLRLELALIEAVVAVRHLDGPHWTPDMLRAALSEEALTTVAMKRYHMKNEIKKALATKLGRRRDRLSVLG